jgi:hypothetical protein
MVAAAWVIRDTASVTVPTVKFNRLGSLPRAFIGDLRYRCSIVGSERHSFITLHK